MELVNVYATFSLLKNENIEIYAHSGILCKKRNKSVLITVYFID